eukprot:485476_1
MGLCLSNQTYVKAPIVSTQNTSEIKYVSSVAILLVYGFQREYSKTSYVVDDISKLILEYYSENRTTINRIGGISYRVAEAYNGICETVTSLTKLNWHHSDSPYDICNLYAIDSMLITAFFTLESNNSLSIYCAKKSPSVFENNTIKTFRPKMIRYITLKNIENICYIHHESGTHMTAIIPKQNEKNNAFNIGFIRNDPLFADESLSESIIRLLNINFAGDINHTIKRITKIQMTNKMMYLLTDCGKLYQKGVKSVYNEQTSAKFHQPASLLKRGLYMIVEDVVCNSNVSFIVDIDGHLYGKGNDKYGLLQRRSIGYSIYKPFHSDNNNNEYICVKTIKIGAQHVIVLDRNKILYVWGSNNKKQLGFMDCCDSMFMCSCQYDIPQKLEIMEGMNVFKYKKVKRKKKNDFNCRQNVVCHSDVNVKDIGSEGIKFDDIICGDYHTFLVVNSECKVYGFGYNNCNQCALFGSEGDTELMKDFIVPTRMTVVEEMIMYNKTVKIIVQGDATYIAVKHY